VTGVIDSFGPGAEASLSKDGLKKGSAVVLNPGVSCGHCEACLGGFDPICKNYGILGESRDGGCADYIVVPAANVVARPSNLSPSEAAALPISYLTAWTMLTRKAQLRPGETVLVHAAGSGVGVASIQLAKLLGAFVITTVGSAEKAAKAQALGADHVINYKETPFREEAKKILSAHGKKGAEVVVDHVGHDTFEESIKCLAWGGRLVTCGATSGADIKLDLKQIFFKNISILGTTMGSKADFLRLVGLASAGKIKPVIDSTFRMDQLPSAHDRLEARLSFGKVVVLSGA
jgi:NADPH:quinone reductase-like Zn-dependent oxidoreductase